MNKIRYPALAGAFYPADPQQLQKMIDQYLNDAHPADKVPKAIIVPRSGYSYFRTIAVTTYTRLLQGNDTMHYTILLVPSHRLGFKGLAVYCSDSFAALIGKILIDPAVRPHIEDSVDIAFSTALNDPRFPSLEENEMRNIL